MKTERGTGDCICATCLLFHNGVELSDYWVRCGSDNVVKAKTMSCDQYIYGGETVCVTHDPTT